ncbi:hypothetical protein AV530_016832 [Patagioenas fasciata monilis]|uniref:Uncharacterized protein n=1 Tax=Patagioenas fasciata monilis TaxID=372326 RepID=A0A1V4J3R5_PATFA|nr:hypothetical protein AV530_016832 [Patagioenas fasciata monilis]
MTSSAECVGVDLLFDFFPPDFCPPSVDYSTINFPSLCETTSTPALDKEYRGSTAIFRKHPLGASERDVQSGAFSDLLNHCITDLLKKHLGLWEEGTTEDSFQSQVFRPGLPRTFDPKS